MKVLSVIFFTLLATGCASSGADKQANNDGLICKMEKPTGSNIATRVCRTPEQMAEHQKASQKEIHDIQRNSVNTRKG